MSPARLTSHYIKRAEVEWELRALVKVAKKMSLPATEQRWILEPGSRQYGTTWTLWQQNPENGGRVPLGFLEEGFLGKTAAEAYHTLKTIRLAWQYLLDNRSETR